MASKRKTTSRADRESDLDLKYINGSVGADEWGRYFRRMRDEQALPTAHEERAGKPDKR